MSTQHTPGPWQLRGSRLVTDSQGVLIAEKIQANYPGTPEANARLIAAAPDLLAALEAVLDLVEFEGRDTGMGGAYSEARDAISKAKGITA